MGNPSCPASVTFFSLIAVIVGFIYVGKYGLNKTKYIDTQGIVNGGINYNGTCGLVNVVKHNSTCCSIQCQNDCEESTTNVQCSELLTNQTVGYCSNGFYCCLSHSETCTDPDGTQYQCLYCEYTLFHRACNVVCGTCTNVSVTYELIGDSYVRKIWNNTIMPTFKNTTNYDMNKIVFNPPQLKECFYNLNTHGNGLEVFQDQTYGNVTGTIKEKVTYKSALAIFMLVLGTFGSVSTVIFLIATIAAINS
jgi:hypothetical protein